MKAYKALIATVKSASPTIYWIAVIHLVLAVGCILGWIIDDRILAGINVWIKPLKFSISGSIYIFTVGYMTTIYPYSQRKRNIINRTTSWTLLIEIFIIVYQAFRGVQSHYNISSAFDAILYSSMGLLIGINVLIMILFVIDAIRLKLSTTPPMRWAILMGWIIVLVGSYVGGQMIGQLSHNVGGPDGGTGLPLLNWSTVIGDLRVAHFFGLHGIQIIPLFAWLISRQWNLTIKNETIAVVIFGLCYAGWIAFTFYQAKQGMPLVSM